MKRVMILMTVLVAAFSAAGQDAMKYYSFEGITFSLAVEMDEVKEDRSVKAFVSDARGEQATMVFTRKNMSTKGKTTLLEVFSELQAETPKCAGAPEAILTDMETIMYYAQVSCGHNATDKQYTLIAAIKSSSGFYTMVATCPMGYKEKYRPIFRKALSSVQNL